jgi:hypothetical protein
VYLFFVEAKLLDWFKIFVVDFIVIWYFSVALIAVEQIIFVGIKSMGHFIERPPSLVMRYQKFGYRDIPRNKLFVPCFWC